MNYSTRRQPSHVPAKAAHHYANSLDATPSLEDITTSREDAASEPHAREGE